MTASVTIIAVHGNGGGSTRFDRVTAHVGRQATGVRFVAIDLPHAIVAADLDTRLFPKLMSTRPVRELIRRLISAKLPRPIWRRLFFPIGAPDSDIDTFFEGYRNCESFGLMFEIIDAEWFGALEPIESLPVTLLWGEHDRVLKSGQIDGIVANAPNAERVIQPGWDHFPMLEQPEEYARVVAELATALVERT